MKERLIGVVLLIAGGVLGYLCVYQPLEAAWSGSPSVSASLKGAILTPMSLIGLMYLALGIGLYIWPRSTLQAHGYDFQNPQADGLG